MIASWDDFMDAVDLMPRYQQVAIRKKFDEEAAKQQYAARRAKLKCVDPKESE